MTNAAASSRTMPTVVAWTRGATAAIGSTPAPPASREGAQQPSLSVTLRVSQARRAGHHPDQMRCARARAGTIELAVRKWLPMLILASAQFVMVLDSSVMNVAISQIVEDLHTTIQGVQTAITLYTLVMAAFMLLGAKLGDIMGRNRAFAIGLAIYGIGSLTTALSPSLAVLLAGWSGVEGFGAVLVIPAIAALTAASYEGRERALAYALLGGVTAIAVAAGPLIGGWVTTNASWRYVFAGETVVVIAIIFLRNRIPRAAAAERRPRLDIAGVALSSSGLGLIVFAILRSSVWGFVQSRTPPTINGTEVTPLGFSPVPFLVLGGLALLGAFFVWEQRRDRLGRDQLLDPTLLRVAQLRAGL